MKPMQQKTQLELNLKIPLGRSPRNVRVEAFIAQRMLESPTGKVRLMESILEPGNLQKALKRVIANDGAPGVDGMTVGELPGYLRRHWPAIEESLLNGMYQPFPVRRKNIAKPDGGVRALGIPTVLDRYVQQAVAQVLQQIWDYTFSDSSFGFRPERSQHGALRACQRIIESGYRVCIDMDLSKFFDRVSHDRLMSRLADRIRDKRVLRLIRAFLTAGVMDNGLESPSSEGTPQGGPLSPLLSNIVLDELDKELESRGLNFVRYADDFVIFVKSWRSGKRVKASITRFITGKLRLQVNEEKSAIDHPSRRKFLGFSFHCYKGRALLRIHPQSLSRFKEKIRTLTHRNGGRSLTRVIVELKRYLQGWWGYFGITDCLGIFTELSGWIRRRLRALVWHQWKNPRTRVRELLKRGIKRKTAKTTGNARKGSWRMGRSEALQRALPNAWFTNTLGLVFPWTTPA
jgi:RNA-directed DNA polymerase